MYQCKRLVKHVEGKNKDTKARSIVNCKAWKHVDAREPSFAKEPRNLHLVLALDGINPFVTNL